MKFSPTRFYLVVRTLHERFGTWYRPGEIIQTPAGRPRSFATAERALGYRDLHLGVHFPVDARLGSELTVAPVAMADSESAAPTAVPLRPVAQRTIWASVAVNLWADDPLDTEAEWDEAKADALRAAVDRFGLARVVEDAVQAAIATHPELARFNAAAAIVVD